MLKKLTLEFLVRRGEKKIVNKRTICIVGNGCAAMECIKSLRGKGYVGAIHLFSDSIWPSYNPMLTTYYAAGKMDFETFFPYGWDIYKQHKVHLHLGSPVIEVDALNRTVKNEAGIKIHYDHCLIASGAKPMLPSIPGIKSKKVYTMRTIEDSIALRQALQGCPRKALVIGASMVGVKVVEAFHKIGVEVCLADLAESIFPLAAHPACAQVIQGRLEQKGIKLRFGAGIERIEESAAGLQVYFCGNKEPEEADLLVMCIGTKANIDFLDKDQVAMDRGILVDAHQRTNISTLYAAGDVAQGCNLLTGEKQIIGLWANARYQGRTAGLNMLGIGDEYQGSIPQNITHFLDMVFVGIGDMWHGNREEKQFDGHTYLHFVWNNEQLIGVNLLDDFTEAGVFKQALLKGLLNPAKPIDLAALNNLAILLAEFKTR